MPVSYLPLLYLSLSLCFTLSHSHRFEYWMITEVDLKKEGWRDRDQMSEEIE